MAYVIEGLGKNDHIDSGIEPNSIDPLTNKPANNIALVSNMFFAEFFIQFYQSEMKPKICLSDINQAQIDGVDDNVASQIVEYFSTVYDDCDYIRSCQMYAEAMNVQACCSFCPAYKKGLTNTFLQRLQSIFNRDLDLDRVITAGYLRVFRRAEMRIRADEKGIEVVELNLGEALKKWQVETLIKNEEQAIVQTAEKEDEIEEVIIELTEVCAVEEPMQVDSKEKLRKDNTEANKADKDTEKPIPRLSEDAGAGSIDSEDSELVISKKIKSDKSDKPFITEEDSDMRNNSCVERRLNKAKPKRKTEVWDRYNYSKKPPKVVLHYKIVCSDGYHNLLGAVDIEKAKKRARSINKSVKGFVKLIEIVYKRGKRVNEKMINY